VEQHFASGLEVLMQRHYLGNWLVGSEGRGEGEGRYL
jgi:hypothetical protein